MKTPEIIKHIKLAVYPERSVLKMWKIFWTRSHRFCFLSATWRAYSTSVPSVRGRGGKERHRELSLYTWALLVQMEGCTDRASAWPRLRPPRPRRLVTGEREARATWMSVFDSDRSSRPIRAIKPLPNVGPGLVCSPTAVDASVLWASPSFQTNILSNGICSISHGPIQGAFLQYMVQWYCRNWGTLSWHHEIITLIQGAVGLVEQVHAAIIEG